MNIIKKSVILKLEKYTPDKKIKDLHKEVELLKEEFQSTLISIAGEAPDPKKYLEILTGDKEKQEKWELYLNNSYVKKLAEIQGKIDQKNLVLCPNLKEKDK